MNSVSLPSVPGPKVMLIGPTGSGKTHSIRTLVEAGKEVFVLFTEPGMEGLSDLPAEKLHWHYIPPAGADWADMLDSAKKINTLSFKALTELPDMNKKKYSEFIDILTCLSNFKCDRTGEAFGAVDEWGTDKVLVIDSLSGLNIAAMNLVVGSKPVKSMTDWQISMDNLERLITKLTTNLQCTFVLTAHAEKETDEMTGGISIMASTLGRKLAPKLPRFFSDVILCKRQGDKFTWSTAETNVDVKTRNLSLKADLPPSFGPLLANWAKKYEAGLSKA